VLICEFEPMEILTPKIGRDVGSGTTDIENIHIKTKQKPRII